MPHYRVAKIRRWTTLEFYSVHAGSPEEAIDTDLEAVNEVTIAKTSRLARPGVIEINDAYQADDGQGNVMSVADWDKYVERQIPADERT
jgi:hypothetical protein